MILHIVQTSSRDILEQCLKTVSTNDVLLFIENAVFLEPQTRNIKHTCFFLEADIAARGVTVNNPAQVINDSGFVELVCKTTKSVTWYL